jgi:hypothetical protein
MKLASCTFQIIVDYLSFDTDFYISAIFSDQIILMKCVKLFPYQ